MAKTPFELRFTTLELARQHLMEDYFAKLELYRDDQRTSDRKSTPPEYPTAEAVMALAKQFKEFVDDSSTTPTR